MNYTNKNNDITELLKKDYLNSKELVLLVQKYQRAKKPEIKQDYKDKVFNNVIRFVQKISLQHVSYKKIGDQEDVFQSGVEGFCVAIDKFKPKLGFAFTTYMKWWVDKHIRDYYYGLSLVYTPRNVVEESLKMDKVLEEYFSKKRNVSLDNFLKKKFQGRNIHNIEKSSKMFKETKRLLSVDKPIDFGNGESVSTWGDVIPSQVDFVKDMEKRFDRNVMLKLIDRHLTEREADIVKLRYLNSSGALLPLKAVGESLHLTCERIRQIEHKAIRKLRWAAKN